MRGIPYKQASRAAEPETVTSKDIREALARQAEMRPAKTPPREMPITPTLPRMPKPKRRRRSG